MSRLVYLGFPTGAVSGGQKMMLRHVETLRELGFDAVFWTNPYTTMPGWLEHRAPVEVATDFAEGDILIVPGDAPNAIAWAAQRPQRSLIFCQNQFAFAAVGIEPTNRFPKENLPGFLAPGPISAASVSRMYPHAQVDIIPCFADERVFKPGESRRHAIACVPRKRPEEAGMIRNYFRQVYGRHARTPWITIQEASERQVAETFGSTSLFLSLSRFEAVGMTPIEAMACGCVVAGFTGVGGWDFATHENGFWAPEDDTEAAADALARAADVALTGGPALARAIDAGRATADRWSYARFRVALEEVWMRLAPQARIRNGPLD